MFDLCAVPGDVGHKLQKQSGVDVLHILTGERHVHKKMSEELLFVLDFQPKLESVKVVKVGQEKIKSNFTVTSVTSSSSSDEFNDWLWPFLLLSQLKGHHLVP